MPFEFTILDWIATLRLPILDTIMLLITRTSNHGEIWIAIGVLLLLFKGYRKAGIMVLIALLIDLLIVNITIKPLIQRERPYNFRDVELLLEALKDYSFPSGHAAVSFAGATPLYYCHKRLGIAAIILASLIAFSRMYLYVHYPSDVLAGVIIGILCGVLSVVICNLGIKCIEKGRSIE